LFVAVGSIALAQDSKEEILTKPFEDRRDLTHLKRVTERTFVHEQARIAFTIPKDWKETPPHRLARKIDQRSSTVLRIERPDRDLTASLSWVQMNPGQTFAEWIRETPAGGEYGEEYETLKAVYGKDRVTVPAKIKAGPFDAYRVNISGGPERGEKYDGALLIFEVMSGGDSWMLKVRISYPKGDRVANEQFVNDVLKGYSRLPEKAGSETPKSPAGS
jgi:hypothetical protein